MHRARSLLLSLVLLAAPAAARAYEMCLDIDPGLTAIVLHVGTTAYSRASLPDQTFSTCFATEATGQVSASLYLPGAPWVGCDEFIPFDGPARVRFAITRVTAGTSTTPPTITCARK